MSLEIKKFDFKTMPDASVILVVAKRNSGKSFLIREILYQKKHIPYGLVCSATEVGNGFYGNFIPGVFIYSEFDEAAVQRLVDRQLKLAKRGQADPVYIVLDDLMYDKRFLSNKLIRFLFMNGRHALITLIVSSQYIIDLPPGIRANIDYVFSLRENMHRERLWKNIFQVFPSFEQFNAVMDAVTADYGALVFNNNASGNSIQDTVFHYKAKARNFKMGSPMAWKFSEKKFDRDWDDRQPVIPGKKTQGIRVVKK